MLTKEISEKYVAILSEELVPAMGCTEPIALAYAAALARQTLGTMPESVDLLVSANIIKNVKSVVVPHTGNMRGIRAAVAAGIVAGGAERELEVLADVTQEQILQINDYLEVTPIHYQASDTDYIFDIQILVKAANHQAFVQIAGSHTNVICVKKDEEVILRKDYIQGQETPRTSHDVLNIQDIIDFADTVAVEDVKEILDRQIACNTAIAEEGLRGDWGAGAGITYLYGGKMKEVSHTVVNAVAINSGMICDGAKASCAAKIASAVEAGLLGMQMQMQDMEFYGGDGIVVKGVENTIHNVGRLARVGMAGTDREIIQIMIGE